MESGTHESGQTETGGVMLDADLMTDFSGVQSLEQISNLILRGLGLTNVSALTGARNVVSVSLSHNDLVHIQLEEGALPSLTELNVNNNRLGDLTWTKCCPKLQDLYASCNRFKALSPLTKCPKLAKVCLHGNELVDLDVSIEVLSALPCLQELELDGNPCETASGYKHLVIAHLPELKRLDCSTILAADRENARSFAAYQQGHVDSTSQKPEAESVAFFTHSDITMPEQYKSGNAARRRPTTSHQNTKQYRDSRVKPPSSTALAQTLASTSMEVLETIQHEPDDAPGSSRLFRDDFLNQNPILVEYMTQAALEDEANESDGAAAMVYDDDDDGDEEETEGGRHVAAAHNRITVTATAAQSNGSDGDVQLLDMDRSRQRPRSGTASSRASTRPQTGEGVAQGSRRSSRRGFASELRQVTAALSGAEALSVTEIARLLEASERANEGTSLADSLQRCLDTSAAHTSDSATASAGSGDDKDALIRRLLKTIEKLKDGQQGGRPASGARDGRRMEELERDAMRLRLENSNMRHLQEENTALRAQIAKLEHVLNTDTPRLQNQQLKAQLKNYKAQVQRLREESAALGRPMTAAGVRQREADETEALLAEVDEYDEELAALVRRNVTLLTEIREDLSYTQQALGTGTDLAPRPPTP